MRVHRLSLVVALILLGRFAHAAEEPRSLSAGKKRNNLVAELLQLSSFPDSTRSFPFSRSREGWIFISATSKGKGTIRLILDDKSITVQSPGAEMMRYVAKGRHTIRLEHSGTIELQKLDVKAIPELIHCGLGFDPQIKSYGVYGWDFLRRDILPNVTTLIVPHNINLSPSAIEDWHRQGKKFVAEVGINAQAKTADEHAKYWTGFYEKSSFLDGIIINEFIVNRPVVEWAELTSERLARMDAERKQYLAYGEALEKMRADERCKSKMLYAYFGGSGTKLNQEIIGTNFIRTIKECGYRVALERYLHEMSSPKGSQEALQTFLDGIADWETKEPGVKEQMIVAFGLFSMPSGSINKQPNVNYHVWMDQQMNLAANHPALSGIAGLEWWTSTLADEETVRFVGKLYRHYAIDGQTNLLTTDPLFLTHIQNADFEKGTDGWILHPAAEGSIAPKSFPRYGRIEGRYMGLGRPPDPEHIGDTFLWMKRNPVGPNTFSQTIQDLQPGRLYSMKMLTCDYQDLVNPKAKSLDEANKFIGSVTLEGVDLDSNRGFSEMYSSNPEPKIPVWITYHWKVFRAKTTTAKLTVSDWPADHETNRTFGQEQTFNFLEIQPYREYLLRHRTLLIFVVKVHCSTWLRRLGLNWLMSLSLALSLSSTGCRSFLAGQGMKNYPVKAKPVDGLAAPNRYQQDFLYLKTLAEEVFPLEDLYFPPDKRAAMEKEILQKLEQPGCSYETFLLNTHVIWRRSTTCTLQSCTPAGISTSQVFTHSESITSATKCMWWTSLANMIAL